MDDAEIPSQETPRAFRPPLASSFISSGSLRLDIAMGGGGMAKGEFIEICGPEGSGKTALCLHVLAEAQRSGGVVAFINADHSLDFPFAKRCGLETNRLYVFEPECIEQALDILESMSQTGALAVIALDSIAALPSRKELSIAIGKKAPAPADEVISRSLRKLRPVIYRNRTCVLITNLIEGHPGIVYHGLATSPGKLALKLHAAQSLSLWPDEYLRSDGAIIGARIEAQILKNKFAPCSGPIRLDLMYNSGINKTGEIIDLSNQLGILDIQDGGFKFHGLHLGRNREEAILILQRNPSRAVELERIIHQLFGTSQSSWCQESISGSQADCIEV
jgi:recombination protein RecA